METEIDDLFDESSTVATEEVVETSTDAEDSAALQASGQTPPPESNGQVPQGQQQPQQFVDPLASPVQPQPQEQQIPLSAIQQIVGSLQQPQQQQPQGLTDEELDAQLRVFRPDESMAKKFFGEDAGPEQVQLLNELVTGITNHLTSVMGYSNGLIREELRGQYQPALDHVASVKQEKFTGLLQEVYPSLKGREAVINKACEYLKSQGFKPKSGSEAGQAVAKVSEQILRSADPQFQLLGPPKQQQQQQTVQSSMPSLSSGAGGGATSGTKPTGGSNQSWSDIWD